MAGEDAPPVLFDHQCPNCDTRFRHRELDYCYVGWPADSENEGGFCCSRECAIAVIEEAGPDE